MRQAQILFSITGCIGWQSLCLGNHDQKTNHCSSTYGLPLKGVPRGKYLCESNFPDMKKPNSRKLG